MIVSWYEKYIAYIDSMLEKLNLYFVKHQETKPVNVLLAMIEQIDPEQFDNFNSKQNSLVYVDTPYKTLGLWVLKLQEVNSYLSTNKQIYNQWSNEPVEKILSTSFMLSTDNFYIDEKLFVEQFKERAIEYTTLIETCKESELGVNAYNVRVLTHFTRCLESTTNSLLCLQSL